MQFEGYLVLFALANFAAFFAALFGSEIATAIWFYTFPLAFIAVFWAKNIRSRRRRSER